ncbi:MAG: TolC family protein [Herminiimonas sp.]|nr:TolC family protein [Herminiimonas sp.]
MEAMLRAREPNTASSMNLYEATRGNSAPVAVPPQSPGFLKPGRHRKRLGAICILLATVSLLQRPAQAAATTGPPLTLAETLRIAGERNRDLRLTEVAVRAAEAAAITAGAAPNPNLTLQTTNINPRAGVGAGSLNEKTVDSTIRLDQLVERGGKRELRSRNADLLAHASRFDAAQARRALILAVSIAYYDLIAAQRKVDAATETATLFDSSLRAAEKRKSAGDMAGAEVERLRVDRLRSQNDARQAEADLARAGLALNLLMATPASAAPRASDDWPALEEPGTGDIEEAVERRPDIVAARTRVEAAQAASRLAQAANTRDVTVGIQFEHYPVSATNAQGTGNSVGIALQIPLFTRYQFQGEIRSAVAGLEQARENLDRLREIALADALRSRSDLAAAADRLRRSRDELLVAARKSMDAAEYAFRNGATSVTDVLDARRTWRAIQIDAITTQADYAKALAAWHAAQPVQASTDQGEK